MLSEAEIEEKYRIVYVGKQRYYYESLVEKDFSLECTTPLSLDVGGKSFISTSWKGLLIEVCKYFIGKYPEKSKDLLEYRPLWSGTRPFSSDEGKNLTFIDFGLYIYCNQTALHAGWLLRDMLKIFEVDLSKCKFVIHRTPFSEPSECRKFYEEKTRKSFIFYYTKLLKHSEEKAEQVLRNIDKLNNILPRFSKAYDNFYLIDDNTVYASYKIKFLDYLRNTLHLEEKNILLSDRYLTILGDFYKTVH